MYVFKIMAVHLHERSNMDENYKRIDAFMYIVYSFCLKYSHITICLQ